MIEWLYGLDYYHWILFGLMLLIAEVFVGGSFLMWIGFSALLLGLLLLLLPLVGIYLGWEWQLVLFGLGALVSLYLWRRYMKDDRVADVPGLNQRGSDLVGRVVPLHDPIVNGEGTIVVHDTHWLVSGPDLPAGTRVRLLSLQDMVFTVEDAGNAS
jgi:membrane protein implicated in regulation of membrane protease activity